MKIFIIAIVSILFSVVAQFTLKNGMSSPSVRAALLEPFSIRALVKVFSNPYILGGFFLYGLGAVIWLQVLAKWDVSKAYPLVGLGFVITMAIGLAIGEQITLLRAFGAVLICIGVLVIGQS